ncbi:MAG: hypothetical protein WD038_04995 [Balneolales bacterium]
MFIKTNASTHMVLTSGRNDQLRLLFWNINIPFFINIKRVFGNSFIPSSTDEERRQNALSFFLKTRGLFGLFLATFPYRSGSWP